ncbi:hypothetical protein M501DRAFT_512982 [Patellaria atrata CBS 101060]|uniref:Uncharacterized protein n=1 Tax=Patellaria atrata CBS 101060 TaxID=1346257 RepID=A0A9P4S2T1_9PEZI|nr:hypothetical protein M501DRAFT_512982 [Patellaria atrata CBS 101060]
MTSQTPFASNLTPQSMGRNNREWPVDHKYQPRLKHFEEVSMLNEECAERIVRQVLGIRRCG